MQKKKLKINRGNALHMLVDIKCLSRKVSIHSLSTQIVMHTQTHWIRGIVERARTPTPTTKTVGPFEI